MGLNDKVLDFTIKQNIKRFEKAGKPLVLEELLKGWEPLAKIGFSEEQVRIRIEEILKDGSKGNAKA